MELCTVSSRLVKVILFYIFILLIAPHSQPMLRLNFELNSCCFGTHTQNERSKKSSNLIRKAKKKFRFRRYDSCSYLHNSTRIVLCHDGKNFSFSWLNLGRKLFSFHDGTTWSVEVEHSHPFDFVCAASEDENSANWMCSLRAENWDGKNFRQLLCRMTWPADGRRWEVFFTFA